MADLSERMQRTASKSTGKAAKEPFTRAKPYPRRITLDLSQDDYDALRQGAFDGDVSIAGLLRGLVSLFRTDSKVARGSVTRAQDQKA